MDINELWIGDLVQILSSGKQGKFMGKSKDGRARVAFQDKILLVKGSNLQTYEEVIPDDLEGLIENDVPKTTSTTTKFNPILDLHIEKLNPTIRNSQPEHILNFQLKTCENFIEKAIELGKSNITIIHGRGSGRLKAEVIHLLGYYDRVMMIESANNGGAQVVLLKQY